MRHEALLFDFFGVICSEVAPFWLAKYLSPEEAIAVKADLVGAADRGDISQDELFSALAKLTGVSVGLIEREWWAYVQIDKRMIDLIKGLRPRFRLGLLTNSAAPFFRTIMTEKELNNLFEVVVVSAENGVAKPDREIYEIALSKMSLEACKTLMIDDNPINISGAIAVGMDGLLFESYEQLRAYMTKES